MRKFKSTIDAFLTDVNVGTQEWRESLEQFLGENPQIPYWTVRRIVKAADRLSAYLKQAVRKAQSDWLHCQREVQSAIRVNKQDRREFKAWARRARAAGFQI